MKKWMALLLTGLMALSLSACGGKGGDAGTETRQVDLTAVLGEMEEACELPEDYLTDLEGEMLEMYYAGIGEVETNQMLIKLPMMSAEACEIALLECKTEEDADKAQEILQARIDYQAGDDENIGGAFYPAAIESWKEASVQRQGNYVAMLAVSGYQDQIEEIFNKAFAD